jgi:hypothetical protein
VDEFALRYYRWSLSDSERELEEDFPLVRRIKSSIALLFLDFAESSKRQNTRKLMTGNIKRFNPRGAELAGDSVNDEEGAVRQEFLDYLTPEVVLQGQRLTSKRVSPRASLIREQEFAGRSRIERKTLKQALVRSLEPLLAKPERAPAAGLHYWLPVDGWHLATSLDLSGRKQLYYGHWISARRRIDSCSTNLQPAISLLSWCGIHPNTSFDLIQEHEIDEVATSIREMCEHFLQHTTELLSGLSHSIPEILEDATAAEFENNEKD